MIGSLTRSSLANKKQYRSLLAGNEPVSYGAYELISTTILGSDANSITFSSIPQTYKHLQIRYTARTSNADGYTTFEMRFNGDTASNYSAHFLYGYANAASANGSANTAHILWNTTAGGTADENAFGAGVIDVLDYSSSVKNKTSRSLSGSAGFNVNPTYGYQVGLASGSWRNTSAITSLALYKASGDLFKIGSRFSLYGIKG